LEELFAGRELDIPAIQGHLRELMRLEGLPYGNRTHTYNSRLAQELSKWGERFSESSMLNQKIFEAYFVDGQNLADQDLLAKLAGEVGLSTQEATEVLGNRLYKEAVDVDWIRSRQIGISGVPTFVIGKYGISGAQPYEMLERFVVKNTV
ncbi:MAG: DsbA family protein, partial [SAR324 cluster bacterium]|nr:DsbA family protein [SAR324 cluster bacterium]